MENKKLRKALFPSNYKHCNGFTSNLIDRLFLLKYGVLYVMMEENGDTTGIILNYYIILSFRQKIKDSYKEGFYLIKERERYIITCISECTRNSIEDRWVCEAGIDFTFWFDFLKVRQDPPKGYVYIWEMDKVNLLNVNLIYNYGMFNDKKIEELRPIKKIEGLRPIKKVDDRSILTYVYVLGFVGLLMGILTIQK